MSIGEAKRLHKRTGQPVLIVGRDGRPIRSDLFAGVPYLIPRPIRTPYQRLINGPGVRGYIAGKTEKQWLWRKYEPEPADVVLTPIERAFALPYKGSIMLEPNVKAIGHKNKDWGSINWQQLDGLIWMKKLGPVVQCTRPGDRVLLHAKPVPTSTFRLTMAVLSVCKAYVGPEGGLHHAAAALGVPGVILFGGFIGPEQTGYKIHRNLFTGGKPCGMRVDCKHCRAAMLDITPAKVLAQLMEILG